MRKLTPGGFLLIVAIGLRFYGNAQPLNNIKTGEFKKRIQSETITYRMLYAGDSAGYTIAEYGIRGGVYKYREKVQAEFNGAILKEDISSSYDIKKRQMVETERNIEFAGRESKIRASWVGRNQINVKIGTKDSVINAPNHLERVIGLFLMPALIHDKTEITGYMQFNLSELGFREITITHDENIMISIPSGKVACSVLRFNGGLANQTFYVDQSTHRVVRIELPDLKWTYEILNISKGNGFLEP